MSDVSTRSRQRASISAAVIALIASLLVVAPVAQADPLDVLFVASSATGSSDDGVVVGTLADAGFAVTIIDDDVVVPADTDGFDVVVISTSASASKLGASLTDIPVPLVNYEWALHRDLGLAIPESSGEQGTFKAIDIVAPSHPIVGGAFSGRTDVFTKFSKVTWGVPGDDAVVVATQLNRPARAVLFTYEVGDQLTNQGLAPARRAGVFLAAASDGLLNSVGDQLLVNTIAWAAGMPTNVAPAVDAGADVDATSIEPVGVPLSGSFTDDGLSGFEPTALWSGPSNVVIDDPAALATTVTVPGPGVYELTLTVDDGELSGVDTLTIDVSDPNGPPEVMFVASTANGTTDDRANVAVLADAGFDVSIIDDNDLSSVDVAGYDVVVISTSASSSTVGSSLTDELVPVVNYDAYLHDDLGLTLSGSANRGEQGTFKAIDVVESSHPIVGGLVSGPTDVFTRFSKVAWGVPSGDAVVIASQLNRPDRAVLFAYEAGDLLASGDAAPARRAGLFLTAASDGFLNSVAEALLVNTVAWAVGMSTNQAPVVDAGHDVDVSSLGPVVVPLSGSFADDGLSGVEPVALWSGPGNVVIDDPTALATSATLPGPGVYELTLSVDDGELSGVDTVTVELSNPNGPPEVMFVASSATGTTDDGMIVALLGEAGFAVSIVDDDDLTADEAEDFDVVVISTSASASKVGSLLTLAAVPVINYEAALHDDLGLTFSGSFWHREQGTFKAIDVVDPSHQIVGGLASGPTDVFTRFTKVTVGLPSPDAVVVARMLNDPDRAVLFTYEAGDVLRNGDVAAARRAGVFLAAASDGFLNEIGEQLLVNTVGWAAEASNRAPIVDAAADQTIDVETSATFTGVFDDDILPFGGTKTPQWSGPPEVAFGSPQSLETSVSVSEPGTYELTLSVDDGLAVGTDTVTLVAVSQMPPTASGSIDITAGSAPLQVSVDGSASADVDGQIVSYEWDFGDGTVAAGITAVHTYAIGGTFAVSLTVTDNNGATDSTAVGTVEVSGGGGGWIDAQRRFRFPISVEAGAADRIDRPASVSVDFGQILAGLGSPGAFAVDSLHLVQRDGDTVVAVGVPVQFDPSNVGGDSGTLLVQVDGTLPAGETRTFDLYFDVADGTYSPITVTPKVTLDQNSSDAGIAVTYAITTEIGTYQYDPSGGGFSSLDDVDGADWIGHDANVAGSDGAFRGVPNMVHPEGQFRPGGVDVTTTVVGDGPLRTTLDVVTNDGEWAGQWQIYPTFARFDLFAAGHNFWFQYEGTPGGELDSGDLYIRSDGSSVNALTGTVATDIAGDEWSMAADPAAGRSFYASHATDDEFADTYRPLGGAMTVMAFGRDAGIGKLMSATPDSFTIGLVDATTASGAAPMIDSARLDLDATTGGAQFNPDGGDSGPVSFVEISTATGQLPLPPAGSNVSQTSLAIADFDGDGVDDIVVAGRDGQNGVQWYRRRASGWDLLVIDSGTVDIEAGGTVGDVDSDGDIDLILSGDRDSNEIWWWENPGGSYTANVDWTRHVILSVGPVKHHDVRFGDVDHDGQPELVYWTQGLPNNRVDDLFVAEVPADPTAVGDWSTTMIYDASVSSEGMDIVDIDLDGNDDLIAGGRLFDFDSATGQFTSTELTTVSFGRYLAAQLIEGGRPEILVSSGDAIGGLDMLSWNGTDWDTTSLIEGASGLASPWNRGHSIDVGDINADGFLDVYGAEMYLDGSDDSAKETARAAIWYGDGEGGFEVDLVSVGRDNHESQLGDVDGDGDLDIVSKPFNLDIPSVAVWLNQRIGSTSTLTSWSKNVIDTKPARSMFIFNADIDGDGDDDLVTGAWWYRNPGNITGTWIRETIGAPLGDALLVADLDGDGHLDVFGARGPAGAAPLPRQFAWAKGDGAGGFTVYNNIESGNSSFIQGAATVQFTETGPTEVWLSWNDRSNLLQKIVVPDNPTVTQWTLETGSAISQGEQIEFVDIDVDGDLDVMEGHIWLENLGDGSAFADHELHTPTSCCFPGVVDTIALPDRVVVGDVNNDGRLDVVVSHEYDPEQRLVWYEQPAGDPTGEWTEHVIAQAAYPIHSLDVRDMDNDGDLDVVAGEHIQAPDPIEEGRVWVFENNGNGDSWSTRLVDDTDAHHDGTQLADLDGDGDLDIFSIGWEHNRVLIFENTFGGPSGPVDTTPPTISGIAAVSNETTSTITWSTNEPADATIDYGFTSTYTDVVALTGRRTNHTVILAGLACATTYHFQVTSSDALSNTASSADQTFDTAACGSDIVTWLSLDEGSGTIGADQGPNGNDATLLGGAEFEAASGDGSPFSVRFDGVDDAMSLGQLDVTGDQLTVAAWFNADTFTGSSFDPRLVSTATGLTSGEHVFMLSTIGVGDEVRLRGRVRVGGSTNTLIADSGVLSTGQWHHAAMTYDGSMIRVYLDGVEVGSAPLSGAIDVVPEAETFVGSQPTGAGSRFFDGLIDDVRIVRQSLSATEIANIAMP